MVWPKGFASVVYGLIVLKSGIGGASQAFHLIALVVTASIIAHSSTDVLVARQLHCRAGDDAPRAEAGEPAQGSA